jgi:hypothetical protein
MAATLPMGKERSSQNRGFVAIDSNRPGKMRLATGHDGDGNRAKNYDVTVMAGAGALLSTANDLRKFLSANLGLTPSSLTPLMKKSQVICHHDAPEFGNIAMPWWDSSVFQPPGMELTGHSGGTVGYPQSCAGRGINAWPRGWIEL